MIFYANLLDIRGTDSKHIQLVVSVNFKCDTPTAVESTLQLINNLTITIIVMVVKSVRFRLFSTCILMQKRIICISFQLFSVFNVRFAKFVQRFNGIYFKLSLLYFLFVVLNRNGKSKRSHKLFFYYTTRKKIHVALN